MQKSPEGAVPLVLLCALVGVSRAGRWLPDKLPDKLVFLFGEEGVEPAVLPALPEGGPESKTYMEGALICVDYCSHLLSVIVAKGVDIAHWDVVGRLQHSCCTYHTSFRFVSVGRPGRNML